MIKSIVVAISVLTSTLALAWDDSSKDSDRYNRFNNEPKSYTLSGDTLRGRRANNYDEYDRYPQRNSNSQSESVPGGYRSGNQINKSGLIINRE